MTNPSDIVSRTQALIKKIRKRTRGGYGACFVLIACFGWFIFILPNPLARIGSGLTVSAMLYLAYQLHARRDQKVPTDIQPSDCTAFYRAELERQRDFHRGSWFWSRLIIMIPGYMLFLVGIAMADPGSVRVVLAIGAFFLGVCVLAVPLNLRLSRKYQRQIDELDALLRES